MKSLFTEIAPWFVVWKAGGLESSPESNLEKSYLPLGLVSESKI